MSSTPGKAGWTWYTGSAAWLNRVSLEWILGIRATWEGLLIDPCPYAALGEVEATRLWRNRTIRVQFDARSYSASIPPRITVNGREHAGNLIRPDQYPSETELNIAVTWDVHVRSTPGQNGGTTASAGTPSGMAAKHSPN